MTPSLHLKAPTIRRPLRAIHRAFTLIELLVVMGIILLLIALLLPAVERAYRDSVRTTMAADLQVISEAIETYRTAFGDYPRSGSTVGVQGAMILCWSLVAPGPETQDGAGDAANPATIGRPGFRIRGNQGTVYGPYLPQDRFALWWRNPTNNVLEKANNGVPSPNIPFDDRRVWLADRYDHQILYYPANKSVSPTTALTNAYGIGTLPPKGYYNYSDNAPGGNLTQAVFAYRLGHNSAVSGNTGAMPVTANEIPILAPYILWSSGPDGAFGPQLDSTTGVATGQDDDVTYPLLDPIPATYKP